MCVCVCVVLVYKKNGILLKCNKTFSDKEHREYAFVKFKLWLLLVEHYTVILVLSRNMTLPEALWIMILSKDAPLLFYFI